MPLGPAIKIKNIKNMKVKQTILRCNTRHLQAINPMGLGAPLFDTYLHNCEIEELEEMP